MLSNFRVERSSAAALRTSVQALGQWARIRRVRHQRLSRIEGRRGRRIIVRVRRNGRAWYGLRAALIGRDGLQPCDGQFQRIRLACFLVASPDLHSGPRFDLAHEAGLQKLGRDLLRRGGFQGLRRDEAAILAFDASDKIARCVSVSLAGELIGIILWVLAALSPSPPRAPNRRRAGRGRRIRRSFHRRGHPCRPPERP